MISGVTSALTESRTTPVGSKHHDASRNPPGKPCFSFAETRRLTSALRAGDEEAFRWLHAQWNRRLFRYCFVLARGDGTLAGELAQAAYIRLFRHIRELPDEFALWNWLARAARSAASDLNRTGGRYRGAIARFTEWLLRRGALERPEDNQDGSDLLLQALDRVLARLVGDELALLEARYFEGVPLEEIGNQLGISARAVEGRLARLRQKMRQLITDELQKKKRSNENARLEAE